MHTFFTAGFLFFTLSISIWSQKIVIKGSDTLGAKLVPQLAEAYKIKNPSVAFEIAAEGSTSGISALLNKNCDLAMSSRRVSPTELSQGAATGVNLMMHMVAFDGLAAIVNEKNPLSQLTKRQVEQIFTGDVTDWSALQTGAGLISVYTRNTASGTYSDWKELAMRKRDYTINGQKMAGNEQIAQEVSKNPLAIGYVGLAYTRVPGLKMLGIQVGNEVVFPNRETVFSKKYPYARPTFYVTNGEPTGLVKNFLEFTLSKEGQDIVEISGFVKVK